MAQQFLRNITNSLKLILKKIYYLPIDIVEIFTRRKGIIPPRSMILIGSGNFIKIRDEFKKHFVDLRNLQPDHRVLAVSCGIGRMAIPLLSVSPGWLGKL